MQMFTIQRIRRRHSKINLRNFVFVFNTRCNQDVWMSVTRHGKVTVDLMCVTFMYYNVTLMILVPCIRSLQFF